MLDKFTEIISHLIGIFHTTIEAERLRDAYEDFKYQQRHSEVNDIETTPTHFELRYTLRDFDPELKYTPLANETPFKVWLASTDPIHLREPYAPGQMTAFPDLYIEQGYSSFFPAARPSLVLEPPGSVVTVSVQSALMEDNDLLRMNSVYAEFNDPSVYIAALASLQEAAQILGVLTVQSTLDFNSSGGASFITLHDLMVQTDDTSRLGEQVVVLHGSEAYGMFVGGSPVETLPLLDDLIPELLQTEDDTADEDDDRSSSVRTSDLDLAPDVKTQAPDDHERIEDKDPFDSLNPPSGEAELFGLESGHQVVTGGNKMVNDVVMNVSWLDAPVISVMGDVVDLNLISQVNVLAEHATFSGVLQGSLSTTFNVAMMSSTSQFAGAETTDGSPEQSVEDNEDIYMGLPKNWAVTRIEGDVLTVNWVQQYSFMADDDRADVQITGTNSYIGLGENLIVNLASLAEIGYGYDLIMIGGDLITTNQISQMNVMLDFDSITATGAGPLGVSVSDNLLFNGASISTVGINSYGAMSENFAAASKAFADGAQSIDRDVAHDDVFTGDELLTVLYIAGDFKTINWVEQTNIMGDSDQVHLALDAFTAKSGMSAKLYTGSNAEINTASINVYGADSEVRVQGDVYSDALLYQADLIDTTSDPTGVFMPALANEAVLFLADGMITNPSHSSDDPGIVPTSPESIASPDLMQTLLA
ncbi:type I secretion protein ATPase [Sulfitobacter sp. Ks41]|uniref:type I secretion protein ATPase n=1 Tax=unclassified Sulfitobacter TaxID=196795 RepID=UPI0023E0E93B|nr:type I secretion protein ATPase [Sulfitobacter sp. Ks41]MDF3362920.1 type I secretion protein ATPase [Sulfitobacter sp. Ks41]